MGVVGEDTALLQAQQQQQQQQQQHQHQQRVWGLKQGRDSPGESKSKGGRQGDAENLALLAQQRGAGGQQGSGSHQWEAESVENSERVGWASTGGDDQAGALRGAPVGQGAQRGGGEGDDIQEHDHAPEHMGGHLGDIHVHSGVDATAEELPYGVQGLREHAHPWSSSPAPQQHAGHPEAGSHHHLQT
eukprot:1158896-Pelagomonas_calceolata.AAC.10